jgi:hypothetical protein
MRGVPIVPVAIQTPAGFVTGEAVGPADGPLGLELGATTPGRLELGFSLDVGLGPPINANAPPSATIAATAAAASVVLDMDRVLRGPNTVR